MLPAFVDAPWLIEHRSEVVLADVRFYLDGRDGRHAYQAAHLPGAVYIELADVLADPPSQAGGRHPLPTPERFARGLGAAGITDADTVIAYDDAGGVIAARLVWLLRVLGRPAALLDGGLQAWEGELETGEPAARKPPATFRPQPWPLARLVDVGEVAGGGGLLIDARDPARFAGASDPVDPRSGHIPGARNVPAREHLGPDGRLRDLEEVRARFAAAGVRAQEPVISYCGSGVTACFNLLALEQAGLGPGRLYPGSWSQWSRDPTRPVQTGS
jgi:thiosulfate/3-mercaptopyruvate sulfurtransferase